MDDHSPTCLLRAAAVVVVVVVAETSTEIVTIGDKGRAQLQRLAPDQIKLSIADT